MKRLTLFMLLMGVGYYVHAQKIKYKDLYVLLNAKNYKDGTSFLTKFLAENPNHPNANYQMGVMLAFKINTLDAYKESDLILARADSAILYFDKAYALINEKELKKNDNYYIKFKRRNLRTGKFEIILSDVQLDMEDRKAALKTKKNTIKLLTILYDKSITFYEQARLKYAQLKTDYKDELSLSLAANDSTLVAISTLTTAYDSAVVNFNNYAALKKKFDAKKDEIIINTLTIKTFSDEALTTPDFGVINVEYYNFSEWATAQLAHIKSNTNVQNNLIRFDLSLDSMSAKIKQDSVDLSNQIAEKITGSSIKEIESIDSKSLPYYLFKYKIGQLSLNTALIDWHKNYKDTLDVGLQLNIIQNVQKEMTDVKALYELLSAYNSSLSSIRYTAFITEQYQSKEGLLAYIVAQETIIANQSSAIDALKVTLTLADSWGYYGEDSVSLSTEPNNNIYQTLYTDSLANRKIKVVGLTKKEESDIFFLAVVPSSRMIDSLYLFELKSYKINDVDTLSIQSVEANAGSWVYLIDNGTKHELIYFTNKLGINWHKTVDLLPAVNAKMQYDLGLIIIQQGESIKKYRLDDGSEQPE